MKLMSQQLYLVNKDVSKPPFLLGSYKSVHCINYAAQLTSKITQSSQYSKLTQSMLTASSSFVTLKQNLIGYLQLGVFLAQAIIETGQSQSIRVLQLQKGSPITLTPSNLQCSETKCNEKNLDILLKVFVAMFELDINTSNQTYMKRHIIK